MKTLNQNALKAALITTVAEAGNLLSFKEITKKHDMCETSSCDFEIVIASNNSVKHVLRFDYHLKLLSHKIKGDASKLCLNSYDKVKIAISDAKIIRRSIGYSD